MTEEGLQEIVARLARQAEMKPPRLVCCPRWIMPFSMACAWADLNLIQVGPDVVKGSAEDAVCILAHEMGHLAHRHGRGAVWLTAISAALLFTLLFKINAVAASTFLIIQAYVLWAHRPSRKIVAEDDADSWAKNMVGPPFWAAFQERRQAQMEQTRESIRRILRQTDV